MLKLITSIIMKKLAISLTFIFLVSFSFGQVPIPPKPKVVPKPIELTQETLTVRFKGTRDDIEKEFYVLSEQGIDTMRDRKTKKLITGSLTVTEANGKVLGVVNLLKGKMHGEELFFDDNGKVKERNYWINGKPSKTPPRFTLPPKIIPPKTSRPSSDVAKIPPRFIISPK